MAYVTDEASEAALDRLRATELGAEAAVRETPGAYGLELDEIGFDELEFSDDELTALALASDVDQPLSPDAVPLDLYASQGGGLLPAWYMPPVTARRVRHWRVPMVWVLIASFLLIDAFGLCITYGQLVAA
jgi:hypothetical protein